MSTKTLQNAKERNHLRSCPLQNGETSKNDLRILQMINACPNRLKLALLNRNNQKQERTKMQGAKASATFSPDFPPQQIATGFPLQPQNFPSAPTVYAPPPQPSPVAPYLQQGGRVRPTEWSSGLCACCEDQSLCCLTCWCPCITFGQIAEIVDEGSSSCCISGGIYGALLCLTGFACSCYSRCYRTKMRAKFNLSEIPCADCLLHCCCEYCALCQEYRELKQRGYHPALGWNRNLLRQQEGMGTPMAAPAYPTMAR